MNWEWQKEEGQGAGGFGVRGEGHTHTHSHTIRYYQTQSAHSALSALNVVIVSPIKRGGVFTPSTIHTLTHQRYLHINTHVVSFQTHLNFWRNPSDHACSYYSVVRPGFILICDTIKGNLAMFVIFVFFAVWFCGYICRKTACCGQRESVHGSTSDWLGYLQHLIRSSKYDCCTWPMSK